MLFAQARETAGRSSDTFDGFAGSTLDALVHAACERYGTDFAAVVSSARMWVNQDEPPDGPDTVLQDGDEVAVLPPVSGG